jgi:hypothetical protein
VALGFTSIDLEGAGFHHRAYVAGIEGASGELHVYIEHDGTPWLDHAYPATDPTPRTPLALELMARDSGPRILLGRPCYFEPQQDPRCGPLLWTHRRYSTEVVASMVAALRRFLASHPFRRALLIGYSGGGTLAWLMARDVRETVEVITVAANLDTDAWTSLHGYSPLEGSLNPAELPPLPVGVSQVDFVGGRDRNVPPAVAQSFARRHAGARTVEIPDFDHECCWVERWPQLLEEAQATLPPPRR